MPDTITPHPIFAVRNLSVTAYANGFTLWHYRGVDTPLETMRQPEFFRPATDLLTAGDIIMLTGSDGCAVRAVLPNGATAPMGS